MTISLRVFLEPNLTRVVGLKIFLEGLFWYFPSFVTSKEEKNGSLIKFKWWHDM